jgi:hypothetical protein
MHIVEHYPGSECSSHYCISINSIKQLFDFCKEHMDYPCKYSLCGKTDNIMLKFFGETILIMKGLLYIKSNLGR